MTRHSRPTLDRALDYALAPPGPVSGRAAHLPAEGVLVSNFWLRLWEWRQPGRGSAADINLSDCDNTIIRLPKVAAIGSCN